MGLRGKLSLPNEMVCGAEGQGVRCKVFYNYLNSDRYGSGNPRELLVEDAYMPEVSNFWSM